MPIKIVEIKGEDTISKSMEIINKNFATLAKSYTVNGAYKKEVLDEVDEKNAAVLSTCIEQTQEKISLVANELTTDINGVRTDLEAEIEVRADEISSTVQKIEDVDGRLTGEVSRIEEKADGIELTVNKLSEDVFEKIDQESNNYKTLIEKLQDDLQNQIDGNITTYYEDGVPLPNEDNYNEKNFPVNTWSEEDLYKHEGDLYYNKENNFAYRFLKDGEHWVWKYIKDNDITKALGEISRLDSALDNEVDIFYTEENKHPNPPYKKGDIWTDGVDLRVCKNTKLTGGVYEPDDWTYATKYRVDLEEFKEQYGQDQEQLKDELQGQIDKKVEYWFQSEDPSLNWKTDDEKRKHVNDLWYDGNITKVYSYENDVYSWKETTDKNLEALANNAQATADGKVTIFYGMDPLPSNYKVGDLWYDVTWPIGTDYDDLTNQYYHDTLKCQTVAPSFSPNDWVPVGSEGKSFSEINQKVGEIWAEVYDSSGILSQLDLKASTSSVEELDGKITTLQSGFAGIGTTIDSKISASLSTYATQSYVTNAVGDVLSSTQSAIADLTAVVSGVSSGLSLYATKTELSTIDGKVTTNESAIADLRTSISGVSSGLSLYATKTEVSDINDRVTTNASAIADLKASVSDVSVGLSLRATKTEVSDINGKVTTNASAIADLRTSISGVSSGLSLYATKTELADGTIEIKAVNDLSAQINDGDNSIVAQLGQYVNKVDGLEEAVETLSAIIGDSDYDIESTLSNYAKKDDVGSLAGVAIDTKISDYNTTIQTQFESYATKKELANGTIEIKAVNDLTTDIDNNVKTSIQGISTEVSGIKTAQTQMTSKIDDVEASIATKVTRDEVGDIISTATINADHINLDANHKLTINGNYIDINTTNFKVNSSGDVTVKGDVTADKFKAESVGRTTTITGDKFELAYRDSSISLYIDQEAEIGGELMTDVPTLCLTYGNKKYKLNPNMWVKIDNPNSGEFIVEERGSYKTYPTGNEVLTNIIQLGNNIFGSNHTLNDKKPYVQFFNDIINGYGTYYTYRGGDAWINDVHILAEGGFDPNAVSECFNKFYSTKIITSGSSINVGQSGFNTIINNLLTDYIKDTLYYIEEKQISVPIANHGLMTDVGEEIAVGNYIHHPLWIAYDNLYIEEKTQSQFKDVGNVFSKNGDKVGLQSGYSINGGHTAYDITIYEKDKTKKYIYKVSFSTYTCKLNDTTKGTYDIIQFVNGGSVNIGHDVNICLFNYNPV